MKPHSQTTKQAFTMVELLSTIAIVAVLAVIAVVYIGNYLTESKRTADRQTLTVLNDALTRYKTQGGNLAALTAEANIGNVLTKLQTTVGWVRGLEHQFLKTGQTYLSASIDATGDGRQYRFTRYDTYGEVVATDGAQPQSYGSYAAWLSDAQAAISSGNHLQVVTSSTDTIQLDVRVATPGDQVWVWWSDGTLCDMYEPNTASNTVITHTYSTTADHTVVIYGDITRIESTYDDGRSDFGGDISTMDSLTYVDIQGSNTMSGSVAGLTGLTHLNIQGSNTLTGSIAGLTNLTYIEARGSNTLSGSVAGLTNLTHLEVRDSNTLSGSVSGLTNLTVLSCAGTNTLSGSVDGMSNLTEIAISGSNTISGSVTGKTAMTMMSLLGSNTISGDVTGMTNLTYISAWGSNTLTGSLSGRTGLEHVNLGGNSTIDTASVVEITGTALGLSYLGTDNDYTFNQTTMDTILVNMDNNKDEYKPRSHRTIWLIQSNHATPSSTGLAAKSSLQSAGWTVDTN